MTADLDVLRVCFRHGVGGHDRLRRLRPVCFRERGDASRQPGSYALDRERLHDYAGGKRQHLFRCATQQRSDLAAGLPGARQTVLTGTGVGAAGVDHQCLNSASLQMRLRHRDRCGAEAVAGEHAGNPRVFGQGHQHQVLATGLADAGFGDAKAHALHRQQQRWIGGG